MPKPLVAIISQGCAANFGDGEKIARVLSTKFRTTFSIPQDEVPVAFYLNVCTVKGNSGALKLLREAHGAFPQAEIFVLGCAPKDFRNDAQNFFPGVKFTTLAELQNALQEASHDEGISLSSKILRASPFTGIVNIEEGCQDACAFCSTHLVKGRLHSFSEESIVEQVLNLVNDGCKEIQLTGQDCGCYGFDTGTNLAKLVQKILLHVPGDYKLRLGMGNPRHVLTYIDALLECFDDDRVYKFVHLPVQSGSEGVLKLMNRRHTAQDFVTLAKLFQRKFARFTLSTDMIVGFPGETDQDFLGTLNVLKETRPTVCNITRFVPRPHTKAFEMESTDKVPDAIKHKRSAALAEAFQEIALQNNSLWIGYEGNVVTEKQGHRRATTIARNEAYSPVALQGDFEPGTKLKVRITGAETFALLATPIQ